MELVQPQMAATLQQLLQQHVSTKPVEAPSQESMSSNGPPIPLQSVTSSVDGEQGIADYRTEESIHSRITSQGNSQ